MEGRDVATVDIPGAFMQVDIGTDLVYIRFDGVMAKVVQKLDPDQYQGCVGQERGKPAIYASLNKALYSTPKGALQFWENLTATLKSWDFSVNPYDWCIANKMIKGS